MKTRMLLSPFLVLAGLGFGFSMIEYLRYFSGLDPLLGQAAFFLPFGIAIVCPPAIAVASRRMRGLPLFSQYDAALSGCPKVTKALLMGLGLNMLLILAVVVLTQPVQPDRALGFAPSVLPLFSAIGMLFYAWSAAFLFPVIRRGKLWRQISCPKGHRVTAGATLCPLCGSSVVPDSSEES